VAVGEAGRDDASPEVQDGGVRDGGAELVDVTDGRDVARADQHGVREGACRSRSAGPQRVHSIRDHQEIVRPGHRHLRPPHGAPRGGEPVVSGLLPGASSFGPCSTVAESGQAQSLSFR